MFIFSLVVQRLCMIPRAVTSLPLPFLPPLLPGSSPFLLSFFPFLLLNTLFLSIAFYCAKYNNSAKRRFTKAFRQPVMRLT